MGIYKVKTISEVTPDRLDARINAFFEEINDISIQEQIIQEPKLIDIKLSYADSHYIALIIYEVFKEIQ